ncbi:hypothetical protein A6R68_20878, partial [Neotoma lepida]
MKDYRPAKGGKKKGDTNVPQQAWSTFSLFCSEFHPEVTPTNTGISIQHVAENLRTVKSSHITKATKLKTDEKDDADYDPKGKFDGAVSPAKVAQKK